MPERIIITSSVNWTGDLCQNCAACCVCIEGAPIRPPDIQALMTGYNLTFDQITKMLYVDPLGSEFVILVAESGACSALSHQKGEYRCHVYENRPRICREFKCHVLRDIEDWKKNHDVPVSNVFHGLKRDKDVKKRAFEAIPFLRSEFRSNYSFEEKKPKYFRRLEKALNGAEFVNSFPPKSA